MYVYYSFWVVQSLFIKIQYLSIYSLFSKFISYQEISDFCRFYKAIFADYLDFSTFSLLLFQCFYQIIHFIFYYFVYFHILFLSKHKRNFLKAQIFYIKTHSISNKNSVVSAHCKNIQIHSLKKKAPTKLRAFFYSITLKDILSFLYTVLPLLNNTGNCGYAIAFENAVFPDKTIPILINCSIFS